MYNSIKEYVWLCECWTYVYKIINKSSEGSGDVKPGPDVSWICTRAGLVNDVWSQGFTWICKEWTFPQSDVKNKTVHFIY